MTFRFRRFLSDQNGATAIEYGLLTALLAVIVVASVALLGDPIQGLFTGVATEFDSINENL